jgi:hypothetical protein
MSMRLSAEILRRIEEGGTLTVAPASDRTSGYVAILRQSIPRMDAGAGAVGGQEAKARGATPSEALVELAELLGATPPAAGYQRGEE